MPKSESSPEWLGAHHFEGIPLTDTILKYCNPMTHDLSALKIAFSDKPDSELTKMQESAQKAANERKLFCQRLLEKKAKVEQDKKLAEKLAANKLKRK